MTGVKSYSSLSRRHFNKSFFYSWEMILVYILIAINVSLMIAVPDIYFANGSIQTIIRSGMDLSIMVLGMTFILVLGEIDVSVSSIMILSVMVMGLTYQSTNSAFLCILLGIIAGALCGLINGLLVSLVKMPSVIVTIATGILFRGIVRVVLQDNYLNTFPNFFVDLAWNDIGGIVPVSLVIFIVFAVIFGIILHKSKFGRKLYIIGNSKDVAKYSGINVDLTKIIAFVIMGITAALSGILFVGRLDGITFSMGSGYELKVIAIVVLGGVSTLGGKGKIYGPVISTFIMAFLAKSLDLFEVHPNVQKIAIGVVLVLAVLIPRLNKEFFIKVKNKFNNKKIKELEKEDVSFNKEKAFQKVLAKGNERMDSSAFKQFLASLSITNSSFNYDLIYKSYLDNKLKYENDKSEMNKQKYIESKQNLKFYNEVNNELLQTKLDLLKANYLCVINEIKERAKEIFEEYQVKQEIKQEIDNNSKSLTLSSWNFEDVKNKEDLAILHKNKNSSNESYLEYKYYWYQAKLIKEHNKEKAFLLSAINKLNNSKEGKNNEKE